MKNFSKINRAFAAKKKFLFVAMSAIVLGMASCGDGNDPQNLDPQTPQDENIPSPTGLTAQTVAHAQCEYWTVQVNLSWNKVAGATSYKVYREDICQEQKPWAGLVIGQVMVANRLIATVTEPSYTDSTDPYHTPNTGAWPTHMETKYTITAITSKGESKPSEELTVEWEAGECF